MKKVRAKLTTIDKLDKILLERSEHSSLRESIGAAMEGGAE